MKEPSPPISDQSPETEQYPLEPRYHPIHKIPRRVYHFLASAKLAMALLVLLLCCCVAGVTVWRGPEASRMVFSTLWFNSILVLLVVNIACCFFGRIWGRRVTVISFGMILFHICFVAILLGIVYNSLFYFRGNIRLTEGEVLASGDPKSYDFFDKGRFFTFSRLKGETSLVKVHTNFKLGDENKRVAYEVAVGEAGNKKQGLIYITNKLTHHRVDYFNDREGYSLLLALYDRQGRFVYGGHMPLQSIRQKDGSFLYTTGYSEGGAVHQDAAPFPAPPEKPLMAVQVEYLLSKVQERGGDAKFLVLPLDQQGVPDFHKPLAQGKAPIGGKFNVGEYTLSAEEVRYWVGMTVRYEPGKPIVLGSLWIGLAGMVITTVGRMARGRKR